jgi:toxin ParE1/3/4
MQVSFTGLALADIENIRAYIAQDNPHAASRMVVALVAATDRLSTNPRLGRLGAVQGTFEWS